MVFRNKFNYNSWPMNMISSVSGNKNHLENSSELYFDNSYFQRSYWSLPNKTLIKIISCFDLREVDFNSKARELQLFDADWTGHDRCRQDHFEINLNGFCRSKINSRLWPLITPVAKEISQQFRNAKLDCGNFWITWSATIDQSVVQPNKRPLHSITI